MKTVFYGGQSLLVEDCAKYLCTDMFGRVFASTVKPVWSKSANMYYISGLYVRLVGNIGIAYAHHEIMEIK